MPTDKMIGGNRITDSDPLQVQVTGDLGQSDAAHSSPVVLADGMATVTATIANGASLSAEVDLGLGLHVVGIITDSAWDTNVMSFQAATASGGTFVDVYTIAGSEIVTGSLVASHWHAFDPVDLRSVRYLKVRSGSSGAAVNQSGATVVTLVLGAV